MHELRGVTTSLETKYSRRFWSDLSLTAPYSFWRMEFQKFDFSNTIREVISQYSCRMYGVLWIQGSPGSAFLPLSSPREVPSVRCWSHDADGVWFSWDRVGPHCNVALRHDWTAAIATRRARYSKRRPTVAPVRSTMRMGNLPSDRVVEDHLGGTTEGLWAGNYGYVTSRTWRSFLVLWGGSL